METIHLTYPMIDQPTDQEPISLAIGFFDGVHLGHQAVIRKAMDLARELKAVPAVMTFDPHPREVLGQEAIHRYLTPFPDKLEQFARLGVRKVYVVRFDRNFASLSKKEFVTDILLPLGVKGVVTGYNFTFGHKAEGKAEDLTELGKGHFVTEIVSLIQQDQGVISSTRLRRALAEGDVKTARDILGRPYSLEGEVVQGDQRGRLMGFPTANLDLKAPYFVPARGVYVVKATMDEVSSFGIMNIGVRPTFRSDQPSERLEVHLLGQSGNYYGKKCRVEFYHFLREEKRFPSVEALIQQIEKDRQEAEQWLKLFAQ
jgi:riboflavin kinase/FMN adenylyltransferase